MSVKEFFSTEAGKAMAWQPPAPDADAPYKLEAKRLQSEAVADAFGGNAIGGTVTLPSTPSWQNLKERDEQAAVQAKAVVATDARVAALQAQIAQVKAAIGQAQQLEREQAKLFGAAVSQAERAIKARRKGKRQ